MVTLVGGEFRFNGVLLSDLDTVGATRTVTNSGFSPPTISCVLADGTPFVFSDGGDVDYFETFATVALQAAALPSVGPAMITAPVDPVPRGLRGGQTLVVQAGGVVGNNFNASDGSTVVVTGGQLGSNFEAIGAQVTISGGSVGDAFDAFVGTTVNVSGGSMGQRFLVGTGSTVNVSGGTVGRALAVLSGTLNITGGTFGDDFLVYQGGHVSITGGEFRINGVLVDGIQTLGSSLSFNVPAGSLFSGILADGTPFAFTTLDNDTTNGNSGDRIDSGTLTLHAAALPAVGPATIAAPTDPVPLGVRGGQTIVVNNGGVVGPHFNAGLGSTIRVSGGQVGENLEAVGAQVNVEAGSVGERFDAFRGSTVNISGGSIGDNFDAFDGSTINLSAGSVGNGFDAFNGSKVNITGGQIGSTFKISAGSQVIIDGGSIGASMNARTGSVVNIRGGSIGASFSNSGGTINISGGSIANNFNTTGGTVNIGGGIVGKTFIVRQSSTVNLSAGAIGDGLSAETNSTINVSGGSIGNAADLFTGVTMNLSGGTVGDDFDALSGSKVNLFGTQFTLGGTNISGSLVPYTPLTITTRNVRLEGMLADGSLFSFDLNSANPNNGADHFSTSATLTVTLVLAGDFNLDGAVNATDYVVWRKRGGTQPSFETWRAHFGQTAGSGASASAAVPEPLSSVLLILAAVSWTVQRPVVRREFRPLGRRTAAAVGNRRPPFPGYQGPIFVAMHRPPDAPNMLLKAKEH
jgi:hypothetical protein